MKNPKSENSARNFDWQNSDVPCSSGGMLPNFTYKTATEKLVYGNTADARDLNKHLWGEGGEVNL